MISVFMPNTEQHNNSFVLKNKLVPVRFIASFAKEMKEVIVSERKKY